MHGNRFIVVLVMSMVLSFSPIRTEKMARSEDHLPVTQPEGADGTIQSTVISQPPTQFEQNKSDLKEIIKQLAELKQEIQALRSQLPLQALANPSTNNGISPQPTTFPPRWDAVLPQANAVHSEVIQHTPLPVAGDIAGNGLYTEKMGSPMSAINQSAKVHPHAGQSQPGAFSLPGEATTYARKLHFLIYSNSSDVQIGPGALANQEFVLKYAEAMKAFFPSNQVGVNIVVKDIFTEGSFESDIAQLSDVAPSDAICCYMSTRGAYSSIVGHSLVMTDGTVVPRSNLFRILKTKQARLTAFITDSCSHYATNIRGPANSKTRSTAIKTYALYRLLFKFKGNLNINGASPDPLIVNADGSFGEKGSYLSNSSTLGGGVFTRSLMKVALFGSSQNYVDLVQDCDKAMSIDGQLIPGLVQKTAIYDESGVLVE